MNKTIENRQEMNKEKLLKELKRSPIIEIACKRTGIGRATFYRWKSKDKKFKKQAKRAIREGVELINELAESQLIAGIKDRNVTSIIFWLKNRNKNYREKIDVTAKRERDDTLTPEEEKEVKEIIKLTFSKKQLEEKGKSHEDQTNKQNC